MRHRKSGAMFPFFTLMCTKDPFLGRLRPSAQDLTSPAIWSGLAHFVKSAVGIASLLDFVSIVSLKLNKIFIYGNRVTTAASSGSSLLTAVWRARVWTPVLARA